MKTLHGIPTEKKARLPPSTAPPGGFAGYSRCWGGGGLRSAAARGMERLKGTAEGERCGFGPQSDGGGGTPTVQKNSLCASPPPPGAHRRGMGLHLPAILPWLPPRSCRSLPLALPVGLLLVTLLSPGAATASFAQQGRFSSSVFICFFPFP